MRQTIAQYVRNCDTCTRIKPARHAPYSLLKPLQVPFRKWSSASLDLVTGLPMSNWYNALLVVVDRLSKMAHYIPSTTDVNSKKIAKLFIDNIFPLHGIPDSIVSDRGTQFQSVLVEAVPIAAEIKEAALVAGIQQLKKLLRSSRLAPTDSRFVLAVILSNTTGIPIMGNSRSFIISSI